MLGVDEKLPLTHSFAIQCLHSSLPNASEGFPPHQPQIQKITVLQVPEKRMLQLRPQQITPKDALLIYTKNVKALPQIFALAFPMALPRAPREKRADTIQVILGFLASLEAVCQTYPSECN